MWMAVRLGLLRLKKIADFTGIRISISDCASGYRRISYQKVCIFYGYFIYYKGRSIFSLKADFVF